MKKHLLAKPLKRIALALMGVIASTGAIVSSTLAQSVFYSNGGVDSTIVFEGAASAAFQAEIWLGQNVTKLASPCGLVVFSTVDNPRQFLLVNGQQMINYQTLPVQTIPACNAGVLTEPRTTNFKTADGKTVLVGQTGPTTAQHLVARKRNTTFNACGFRTVSIKNAATLGADSIGITFGGHTSDMGDLNQITALPICKKVGSSFVKYVKVP